MIALFKSWGSKQGQIVPSDLLGYVSDETHLVGSVTGAIIQLSVIFCNVFFYFFSSFNWNFPLGMLSGDIEGSTLIIYCSGIFPVVSKLLGNAFFRAIKSLISVVVRWSCEIGFVGDYGPVRGLLFVYDLEKVRNSPVYV